MPRTPDRPTYQIEPREQLEERLRIVSGLLGTVILSADDEGCGCATCQTLRDMGDCMDMAAAIDVNVRSIVPDTPSRLSDWPTTEEGPDV